MFLSTGSAPVRTARHRRAPLFARAESACMGSTTATSTEVMFAFDR
jgi:hypothetical protein